LIAVQSLDAGGRFGDYTLEIGLRNQTKDDVRVFVWPETAFSSEKGREAVWLLDEGAVVAVRDDGERELRLDSLEVRLGGGASAGAKPLAVSYLPTDSRCLRAIGFVRQRKDRRLLRQLILWMIRNEISWEEYKEQAGRAIDEFRSDHERYMRETATSHPQGFVGVARLVTSPIVAMLAPLFPLVYRLNEEDFRILKSALKDLGMDPQKNRFFPASSPPGKQ